MVTQQRLARSNSDKVIAGVCGGLGQYFGIDPVIVRLIMVALVLAGGVSILIYPILWLVTPVEGATQYSINQGWQDMQRQAQNLGQQASQQVQSVFAQSTSAPRFDPETGQPIGQRRNRTLGYVLVGLGALMLASYFGSSQLALALMVLGGGFYLLRRSN